MSFSNIDALNLGKFLQIIYQDGVRNQLSEEYKEWSMIQQMREGNSLARQIDFFFKSALGPAAVQYRDPGATPRAFPRGQQISTQEHTAKLKELTNTIFIEYQLWDRARKSPEKYGEPLAEEMESKAIVSRRRLAADLYGDGTGVMGVVDSVAAASGRLVVTLRDNNDDQGHVGLFEFGDILKLRARDTSASALDTDLATEPVYWQVKDKNREAKTVTLQGLDASFAEVAVASITTPAAAGEVFYRLDASPIDLTSAIADYATAGETIAGLESLLASDGRTIHGITMEGAVAGSRIDAGGNAIDVKYIEQVMNKAKIAVGENAYSWKMAMVAPEVHSSFVEGRETDRRFQSIEDNKKGLKQFAYVHRNDTIALESSEYVPPKRFYIMPEGKGKKLLAFHGTDFEMVKGPGEPDLRLRPASGGSFEDVLEGFMTMYGVIICNHPAAFPVIENFTV